VKRKLALFSGIVFLLILVFSILSFTPFDSGWFVSDPHYPPVNLLGSIGVFVSSCIFFLFGSASYGFGLLYAAFFGWMAPIFSRRVQSSQVIGILILFLSFSMLFGVIHDPFITDTFLVYEGGLIGNGLASLFITLSGVIGAYIVILISIGIGISRVLLVPFRPLEWLKWFQAFLTKQRHAFLDSIYITRTVMETTPPLFQRCTIEVEEPVSEEPPVAPEDQGTPFDATDKHSPMLITTTTVSQKSCPSHPMNLNRTYENIGASNVENSPDWQQEHDASFQQSHTIQQTRPDSTQSAIDFEFEDELNPLEEDFTEEPQTNFQEFDLDYPEEPTAFNEPEEDALTPPTPNMDQESTASSSNRETNQAILEEIFASDQQKDPSGEGFACLELSQMVEEPEFQEESREIIVRLEQTFKEFKIEAKVVHVSRGPVITRYEVEPAPGIKLSKIVGLTDNITLALAVPSIRVVAPIPGKKAVGIEVPNKQRRTVTLGDILTSDTFDSKAYQLPVALGLDLSGNVVVRDLVSMPHVLIAGSTGSGKSVCINSLICSLLYCRTPEEIRLMLVDPKIVELKMYNDIPHLLTPVITEPQKAAVALKWAVSEMERRYQLLDQYHSRDIRSYNQKIELLEKKKIITDGKLEYLVIIVDELADLMMVAGKEVEEQIARLAAMSRAVGIHLVLATQRPSVDIITGIIKANCPSRIAFQVSSRIESRIILDTNGAEKLLGKGDMLLTSPGLSEPYRIQGAMLTEDEVHEITSYLKKQAEPKYVDDMFPEDEEDEQIGSVEDEPLWKEAVAIVVADGKASASYLQRRMKIGYNRAARIVELMEQEGIVGPALGSKPREVLISSV
jgi:DNA segregation ATPase FtsK/SpoIIIE-like protein